MSPFRTKKGKFVKTGVHERILKLANNNKTHHKNHILSSDHNYSRESSQTTDDQQDNGPHTHVDREEIIGTEGDDFGLEFSLYQDYMGRDWSEGWVIVRPWCYVSSVSTMFPTTRTK